MFFEWDETKRKLNIKKHGIDFINASVIFDSYILTIEDNRFEYGEERFITFGLLMGELSLLYIQKMVTLLELFQYGGLLNMKKKHIFQKSQTNWDHVDGLHDKDIDFSDNPEVTPEMFAKAILRNGLKPVTRKTQITLRIDEEVLMWFKSQGKGYQTRINTLLKAYKEAHQNQSAKHYHK